MFAWLSRPYVDQISTEQEAQSETNLGITQAREAIW